MPGKSLSPWTLGWFGSAVIFLLLALVLAFVCDLGPGDWARPQALAVVHLFTLGWLAQVMLGALVQFVPVLTAYPLPRPALALPALLATGAGTLALSAGFLGLDGHTGMQVLFRIAPLVLGCGFALVAVMILPSLARKANLHLIEVRMVLIALAGLAGLWTTGGAMVLTLGGASLTVDLAQMLPLHMLFGIGAFLSFAAFGVSYKLFAMFLLAPETAGWQRRWVGGLAAVCAVLMLAALAVALSGAFAAPIRLALSLPALALCGLYLDDIRRLWRKRRRPALEPNMAWSRVALVFLGLSAALLPVAQWQGGRMAEAAVFAALVGWLSTLTLSQLIRITSFLTWIQVFAPLIGRRKVPVVQQISDRVTASRALALWSASTGLGVASLLFGSHIAFRLALAGLFLAAAAIARELVAIRKLWHLPVADRPPCLPPIIRPSVHPLSVAEP